MFYQIINKKTGKQVSTGLTLEMAKFYCSQDRRLVLLPWAL